MNATVGPVKKEKGAILDEFVKNSGVNRYYARRLPRSHGLRVEVKPGIIVEGNARLWARKTGPVTYGPETVGPLKKRWVMSDYLSGKRLKPALAGLLERLETCKELRLAKAVRAKRLQINPATIDRLLKLERDKHTLKRWSAFSA